MRRLIYLITAIFALCLTSCRQEVAWCETQSIGSEGWSSLQSIEFALQEKDSAIWLSRAPYTVSLSLRYSDKCPERRVKLITERESLEGIARPDTLLVTLFNDEGSPANDRKETTVIDSIFGGKGLNLGIYEKSVIICRDTPIPPMMRIAVTPATGVPVMGITHLTLMISRQE